MYSRRSKSIAVFLVMAMIAILCVMCTAQTNGDDDWLPLSAGNTGDIYHQAGKVGIGTNAPQDELDVTSPTNAYVRANKNRITDAGGFKLAAGGDDKWSILMPTGSEDLWFWDPKVDARLLIKKDTGNVGIGLRDPGSKLSVQGGVSIGDATYAQTAAPTEGMIIEGNVGIGTTDPDPNSKLDVVNSLGDSWIRVGSDVANSIGGIKMRNDARTWIIETSNDDKFKITDSTADMHRLTIETTGYVGIGTDSPEAELDVRGYTARIESSGHANFEIQAGGSGSAYLHLNPVSNTKRWKIIAREDKDKLQFWPGDIYFTRTGNIEKTGGAVCSFVEEHPQDPTKEIVYTCLEGPEAGTYVRGTAQLVDGEAVVNLPEHFSLVTSDEGLTVQLTAVAEWLQLCVVEKGTQRIVVREADGRNAQFDYLVQGVRKGHEDYQVIRDKE